VIIIIITVIDNIDQLIQGCPVMTRLSVLSPKEKSEFCSAPKLKKSDRSIFFALTPDVRNAIKNMRNDTNRAGFIIQLGYFKASSRFFTVDKFRQRDINYVKRILNIRQDLELDNYTSTVNTRHQRRILEILGWQSFEPDGYHTVVQHLHDLSHQQMSPTNIFHSLIDFCWKNKIEVPSYYQLSMLITDSLNEFEDSLIEKLTDELSIQQKKELDCLFDTETAKTTKSAPITRYKRLRQSFSASDISHNVNTSQIIATYYFQFEPIIEKLALTDQATEYFASWVNKATTFQLKQFPNPIKGYLYLLSYIRDQYFRRQDSLVETFLKCVQSNINQVKKIQNEADKKQKQALNSAINNLRKKCINYKQFLDHIVDITQAKSMSENERMQKIEQVVEDYLALQTEKNKSKDELHDKQLENVVTNKAYYDILEEKSLVLQNKVSKIIKFLTFDEATSDATIISAINYFKQTDGDLGDSPPLSFLKKEEKILFSDRSHLRISLYKSLLFDHIKGRIKSGRLNLKYSYQYRAIQDYLISEEAWAQNKSALLRAAGLSSFSDGSNTLNELKGKLDNKYALVNKRLQNNEYNHIRIGKDGRVHTRIPKTDYKQDGVIGDMLKENGYVHILDVLREANNLCNITDCFTHSSIKHTKMKPSNELIMAGIMGLGCNIGVRKIANISVGVSEKVLDNTVNWCFDLKNIQAASRKLRSMISKLSLSNVFKNSPDVLHTSSDGRKVTVGVESLQAAHSFKYYGKDKGMSMYGFIDQRQVLFHSMVISPAEREAAFVIDGLLQNDVSEQVIHSTDTHGYTESIFAATHFIGVSFAPRIKNVGRQHIYGFSARSTYKKRGYNILPTRTINRKLILNQWDSILRFMATITLKHTPASQLFRRLNSYATEHALYKGIKEFGRIIKSHFILSYYDDVELCQQIEKQLSRIELSNKFEHAVFFDNNQEFQFADRDQQEKATACKSLIQNAIVLWNYLFLSQKIATADSEDREEIVTLIKTGSMISWAHVNLKGEYDFTRQATNDDYFDFEKILSLKIA